jgi:hypothetical protein
VTGFEKAYCLNITNTHWLCRMWSYHRGDYNRVVREVHRRFGGTYCLRLQYRRVRWCDLLLVHLFFGLHIYFKTEAVYSCETSVDVYRTRWCYISEYTTLHLLVKSVYGCTALVDLGRCFSLLIIYTVGRTPWTGEQPVARPLPTHRTTQTQNKLTQTSMPWVGFYPRS